MEIKLGSYDLYEVINVEPSYYVIKNADSTLRLYKQDATRTLSVGEKLEVFLFINQSKKIVATMKEPLIDEHRSNWVEVVEVKFGLGVFVNIGLSKDMLVSKDDLPVLKREWPDIGDQLYCYLRSGKNQLLAKMVSRFQLKSALPIEKPLELNEPVNAYVIYIADEGWVFYTKEGHEIFVYFKHSREKFRLGQEVEITVTLMKDEQHYNGTALKQKELMLDDDAKRILEYIESQDGTMPYTDKSDPEEIYEVFKMSKAAFKRALGTLYKEKKVKLDKDETSLIN